MSAENRSVWKDVALMFVPLVVAIGIFVGTLKIEGERR